MAINSDASIEFGLFVTAILKSQCCGAGAVRTAGTSAAAFAA